MNRLPLCAKLSLLSCFVRVRVAPSRLAALAAVTWFVLQPCCHATAAQSKKTGGSQSQEMTLYAKDGWPIHITYYESQLGKDAPVVVLLHGKSGSQLAWTKKGFASVLSSKNYAVIAVDLRKHGLSKPGETSSAAGSSAAKKSSGGKKGGDATNLKPTDYQAMVVLDMEAVKRFIYDEHQQGHLNMRKLGIVAVDMSAVIAIGFASNDWAKLPYDDAPTLATRTPRGQDVQALVLISPETSLPRLSTIRPISFLKDPAKKISFMICVGEKDSIDKGQANRLYKQLGGTLPANKERVYFQEYKGVKLRGEQLLGKNIGVERHTLIFLDTRLKSLQTEWRDRKSRL